MVEIVQPGRKMWYFAAECDLWQIASIVAYSVLRNWGASSALVRYLRVEERLEHCTPCLFVNFLVLSSFLPPLNIKG